MFADPQNDPDYRAGLLQHTLESCVEDLHQLTDCGHGRWISVLHLVTLRAAIEGLIERLETYANAA